MCASSTDQTEGLGWLLLGPLSEGAAPGPALWGRGAPHAKGPSTTQPQGVCGLFFFQQRRRDSQDSASERVQAGRAKQGRETGCVPGLASDARPTQVPTSWPHTPACSATGGRPGTRPTAGCKTVVLLALVWSGDGVPAEPQGKPRGGAGSAGWPLVCAATLALLSLPLYQSQATGGQ